MHSLDGCGLSLIMLKAVRAVRTRCIDVGCLNVRCDIIVDEIVRFEIARLFKDPTGLRDTPASGPHTVGRSVHQALPFIGQENDLVFGGVRRAECIAGSLHKFSESIKHVVSSVSQQCAAVSVTFPHGIDDAEECLTRVHRLLCRGEQLRRRPRLKMQADE